jgi:hypothetical protein
MQILHALGAIERGLRGGVGDPLQGRAQWDVGPGAERFGEQFCLIKSTLAFARRMQRHRHDDVEVAAAQTRIRSLFGKAIARSDGANAVADCI